MKPCCERIKAAALEAMDKIMGDMKYTTNTIQRSYTIEAIADIRVEFNLLLSQLESEADKPANPALECLKILYDQAQGIEFPDQRGVVAMMQAKEIIESEASDE